SLAKRRTQPVSGVGQDAAKAHTGHNGTVDLRQSDLRLRTCCLVFGRNACALQPGPLARPTLGKKQPQRTHDRDFPARQRQRYQGLAVRGLAQRRSILWGHTDRTRAFLRYRGVVDGRFHPSGAAFANAAFPLTPFLPTSETVLAMALAARPRSSSCHGG